VRSVDSHAYHAESKLVDSRDGVTVVGCGTVIDGACIEIRSEHLDVVPADTIGEIWVKAPFLMQGYFRRPELDSEVFRAGWYRTGDLGCVDSSGELYVTGRLKDLIIVGGINIPPQDVEEIASGVSGVVAGRVVAIGPWDKKLETQKLVLLVESHSGTPEERNKINLAVRSAVAARTQVQVSDVRVFPRGTLHKSTSGKLSRTANLRLYETGPSEDAFWA
jgi:fatty-acyl-CoA synthase